MSRPIGEAKGKELERYLHETVGVAGPLGFARSFMRYKIDSLAELTPDQGRALMKEAEAQMKIAREQIKKERERDDRRRAERERELQAYKEGKENE